MAETEDTIRAALTATGIGTQILGINTAISELQAAFSNRAFFARNGQDLTDQDIDIQSLAAKTDFFDSPLFDAMNDHREALRAELLRLNDSLPPLPKDPDE